MGRLHHAGLLLLLTTLIVSAGGVNSVALALVTTTWTGDEGQPSVAVTGPRTIRPHISFTTS